MEFNSSRLGIRGKTVAWLQGGLGNQLFQWNAALHASEQTQSELLLSGASYARDKLRNFVASSIVPSAQLTNRFQDLVIGTPFAKSGRMRKTAGLQRLPIAASLDSAIAEPSLLVGFFQDAECLQLPTSDIVKMLRNRRESMQTTPLADRVTGRPVIHVRRGDYVIAPAAIKHFGSIRPEYYFEAFDRLGLDFRDAIAFTDDPAYVTETFGVKRENVIGPSDTPTDLDGLLAMSLADSLVIPNSTFSWWAAEIAGSERPVIVPENWFVDERRGYTLARDAWRRVPN